MTTAPDPTPPEPTPSTLTDWAHAVAVQLGLETDTLDPALVLDLARDVAHRVARPAAPLTAYLVGVAVGRGADPAQAVAAVARIDWP